MPGSLLCRDQQILFLFGATAFSAREAFELVLPPTFLSGKVSQSVSLSLKSLSLCLSDFLRGLLMLSDSSTASSVDLLRPLVCVCLVAHGVFSPLNP